MNTKPASNEEVRDNDKEERKPRRFLTEEDVPGLPPVPNEALEYWLDDLDKEQT